MEEGNIQLPLDSFFPFHSTFVLFGNGIRLNFNQGGKNGKKYYYVEEKECFVPVYFHLFKYGTKEKIDVRVTE